MEADFASQPVSEPWAPNVAALPFPIQIESIRLRNSSEVKRLNIVDEKDIPYEYDTRA